jgi:hypothetical protein
MNKKKIIFQLLEKKFVFLFAITSILIFFLTLNTKDLSSTFTIRVLPNNDSIFKTQVTYAKLMPKPGDISWLNDKDLMDSFLTLFFQNNNDLKFRVRVKKEYFSSTTLLIFDGNQQFDYQVAALLNNYNDTFIEVIEKKFKFALEASEENILVEALVDAQTYSSMAINDENKKDLLKTMLLAKREKLKEHFLFLKKNKIFKFEVIAKDEKKFNKELIAIIISIFGAFLINIAILIFTKYKKYI